MTEEVKSKKVEHYAHFNLLMQGRTDPGMYEVKVCLPITQGLYDALKDKMRIDPREDARFEVQGALEIFISGSS